MRRIACVFPGQGSQVTGMCRDIAEKYESARKVFESADSILGYKISEICFNGPDEVLKETRYTQPAILTASIACLEVLRAETDLDVTATAGHSLGEYGALYLSGVLSPEDVIQITSKRAELMSEAATQTSGGMAAVIGLSDEALEAGLSELRQEGIISAANYNCPGQIVITGEKHLIEKSIEHLKGKGAKRVLPLPVSGAFHSELMREAGEKFREYLKDKEFRDGKIPVYENTDGLPYTDGNILRDKLPKQIYTAVRWTSTIENMAKAGTDIIAEIGPGKVLSGLIGRIAPGVKVLNVNDIKTAEQTIQEIRG